MALKIRKREERLREEGEEGFTLVESMVALIILSVLFIISISAIAEIKEKSVAETLVRTFQSLTSEARGRSISEGVNFGIVFKENNGEVLATLYKDGDFDGITTQDIKNGIDKAVSQPEILTKESARIAIPEGVTKDPSNNKLNGEDAIRFGKGNVLTFSPKATATPGTLYISEGFKDDGWAIRVAGIDGRIRIYRCKNKRWSEYERW
ncbi:MAG: prepilin-type N-terminal cleavage/methylation domain-containing protein [Thermoanaerobaculaceae bacterium]|nr:prepilin-type N-terminal cleavage/methylation domain-containing protein [Thermoanaerobaculaceae bacterium]